MKTFWNSLVIAFAMYSKIPMPQVEWTEKNMKYPLCFFPLVGAVIGALLCGWNILWPYICEHTLLPAAVFVILPVVISGGIHVDGFIDTVDAVGSNKPMEKKLEILKDTHTGAFAIIMTIIYFVFALGVWSEMPSDAVPLIAFAFVISRALSGLAVVIFPHAKTSRLLAVFADHAQKKTVGIVMVIYIVGCAAAMCWLEPLYGLAGVLGAAVSFGYYYYMAKKHFGGITGDVAGYFVQVCELVIPCFVLAAWKLL